MTLFAREDQITCSKLLIFYQICRTKNNIEMKRIQRLCDLATIPCCSLISNVGIGLVQDIKERTLHSIVGASDLDFAP